MSGQKPRRTQLKVVQGTFRKDRANPSEPKPHAGVPPCPKFLQGDAREHYRKTGKKLVRIRLLTKLDDMALAMLCQSWEEYLEAMD